MAGVLEEQGNVQYREDPEHPWDQELRGQVLEEHGCKITEICKSVLPDEVSAQSRWDFCKEAIAVIERSGVPIVGPSVDRRCVDHLVQVYNDRKIRSLICFCCAQVKTDTGQHRSPIEERSGRWLYNLADSTVIRNFSYTEFRRRYCKPGTPLAAAGSTTNLSDCAGPDFSDWLLMPHPDTIDTLNAAEMDMKKTRRSINAMVGNRKAEFLS